MTDLKRIYPLFFIGLSLLLLLSCSSVPQEKEPFWIETANSFTVKGVDYYNNQRFVLAKNEFNKALNAYQRFNDVQGMAQCRLNLAKTFISLGEDAGQHIERLYSLINENNLDELLVHADIMRASIMINNGLYDNAEKVLAKHINKSDLQKDVFVAILINRLRVAFAEGVDIDLWLNKYEISIGENNRLYNARLLRFKAQQEHSNSNTEKTNKLFKQALSKYRLLANSKGVYLTLKEWGDTYADNKDWVNALSKYSSALITAKSTENRNDISNSKKSIEKIQLNIK
jgi:tetratricopeptide (TPR) repeat protein